MPDSITRRRPRGYPQVVTAAAQLATPQAMAGKIWTGAAGVQDELWMFYEALGEFGAFVDWVKNACSRVRLGAAELVEGADEPEMLREGAPAQLISEFYGGSAGQMAFWQAIIPQLLAPGEGWVLAERFDPGVPLLAAEWSVQSTATFRQQRGGKDGVINKVQIAEGEWRDLLPDSLPTRVWMPDPLKPFLARSPARAALPIMRRLDLVDKRIMAELLSRAAMNGILWMPMEGQLPVSPAYKDQADGFWQEFIDIGTRNIGTPGSAGAAFPYPVKFPAELISKIMHMKLSEPFDEQLLAEREFELGRLAKSLPLSAERQQGMAEANHWTGWVIKEDDIKISIQPTCEIVFDCLTKGFLLPMLAVAGQPLVGPNGGKLIVWGDYSELTSAPDKSAATRDAYDRGEVNGTALRRESGLDESDIPTPDEQRHMIWLKAARDGSNPANPLAIQALTGQTPPAPTPAGAGAPVGPDSTVTPSAPAPAGPPTSSAPDVNPLPTVAAWVPPRKVAYDDRVGANGHRSP